jgi:hypothetical protein
MRPSYFLVCALLSPAVIGCSDSLPPPPNVKPTEPTAVHVKSEVMPLMVAYRDGFDITGAPVAWTVVPATTPDALKMVTFMAHDAYSIAVVCAVNANTVLTWQSLRTVADDTSEMVKEATIETPCTSAPPARNLVTVKMVQAGFVHLDDADGVAASAGQDVTLSVTNGTFDLVATTNLADPAMNKTAIRRDVTITGTQTLADIDASMGLGQIPLAISLDNPPSADPKESTEVVTARVDVTTKNNSGAARVSEATYDLDKMAIKIYGLPSAMLTPDDTQSATFVGTEQPKDTMITTTRSVTKPFATGDKIATGESGLALPPKIAIPDWGLDAGRLTVALPTLPTLDSLSIETSGTSLDGTKTAKYQMDISSGYFDTTTLARPVFDTDIAGFQPAWKINFKLHYSRQITSQFDARDEDGVVIGHETSQFFEDVPPAPTM